MSFLISSAIQGENRRRFNKLNTFSKIIESEYVKCLLPEARK